MRTMKLLSICITLILLCNSCGKKSESDNNQLMTPESNPFIQAFTSGHISRFSTVKVVFAQNIPAGKMNVKELSELFEIHPAVKGSLNFENENSVTFVPETAFERNTIYTVSLNLSKWFDATLKNSVFKFQFKTLPLDATAQMQSLDINEANEQLYDIKGIVFTPDKEDSATINKIINLSEKAQLQWNHSADGRIHQFTIAGVKPEAHKRTLTMSAPEKSGVINPGDMLIMKIPDNKNFSVYTIKQQTEGEKYLEITFTQLLSQDQDMEGLIHLSDISNSSTIVDKNKIKVYINDSNQKHTTVTVSGDIKNKQGVRLGAPYTSTIELQKDYPDVRFVGNGGIIPNSSSLIVPIQSINLRGVTVRVIKILEQNIGLFLQTNALDGDQELTRMGRLITRKTIFLDEYDNYNQGKWTTYGIDLSKLITPEPGAIYRVELTFNRQLSTYPCDTMATFSKEAFIAEDKMKEKAELNIYNLGMYFYNDNNWADYDWNKQNDPCSDSYYFNKKIGKNILATDLGVMAKAGDNNTIQVFVNNMITTEPEGNVEIKIYNYQNQLMSQSKTEKNGSVTINYADGKPFYLIASKNKQRTYLKLDDGSALSISTFDVGGDIVQNGLKGFIYADRGVWRPGDTIFVNFILNDREHQLPAEHPVILELRNPQGQLYTKRILSNSVNGFYCFDVTTDQNAPTGYWTANVNVGGVTFSKRLRIESIKPNRLKVDLTFTNKILEKDVPINGKLHVNWLTGANAQNMKFDIKGTFIATKTEFPGFKDFIFDNPAKKFQTEESSLIKGVTDANGNATINSSIKIGNAAPGMLMGSLTTKVYEQSGDFSVDAVRCMYSPYKSYVGIQSPQDDKKQLDTDKTYTFPVVSVDPTGKVTGNIDLEVSVYKVTWYWWWSSDNNNLANFMSSEYNKPEYQTKLKTDATGHSAVDFMVDSNNWGAFYIQVKNLQSGHTTGVMSYFDVPGNEGKRSAEGGSDATVLSCTTDKQSYSPGETMVVTFPSSKSARALISIENGTGIVQSFDIKCEEGQTQFKMEVTPEMQPNIYIYVTLLQPHAYTGNDLPIRMYGIASVTISSKKSHLNPLISSNEVLKPGAPFNISVSEKSGSPMTYTIAIVDEGLLDLTKYKTPDPWHTFFAKEALGVQTWDMYNYVLGAFGGKLEQVFSIGGDDALNKGPKAIVNRFKPVVIFKGPFELKKGEKKAHRFTMPNYVGRVKAMVVAGSENAYGSAEKSMYVRKPVMILGTLPRILSPGEELLVPATVFGLEDHIGDVTVSFQSNNLFILDDKPSKVIQFSQKGDRVVYFKVKVGSNLGAGKITLTAKGKGDVSVWSSDILIRSAQQPVTKVTDVILAPNKGWNTDVTYPGMKGTNKASVEVSGIPPVNLDNRLNYLLTYPYGCIEQIVSGAFPQLYLSTICDISKDRALKAEQNVKATLKNLRQYQMADGAMAYWPGTSNSNGWGTVYAGHFMLEAERKGYAIPEGMKLAWLNNQKKAARKWTPLKSTFAEGEELLQAYRLFVLAMAQSPEIGAMNRLKEKADISGMAKWMLASAYGLVGRNDIGVALIQKTVPVSAHQRETDDYTFGSNERNMAIQLQTLCVLNQNKEAAALAMNVSKALSSSQWMSTQTTAYCLIAMSQYIETNKLSNEIAFNWQYGANKSDVKTSKSIWSTALNANVANNSKLTIQNKGKGTLYARVITTGTPAAGQEVAVANGISLQMRYTDLKGNPIYITTLRSGTNFVATAIIKNVSAETFTNLMLTQLVPSGWEILNTRYMDDHANSVSNAAGVTYQDIRDDRVSSFIPVLKTGQSIVVHLNLNASYLGKFYLPGSKCEAMYNNQVSSNTAGEWISVTE